MKIKIQKKRKKMSLTKKIKSNEEKDKRTSNFNRKEMNFDSFVVLPEKDLSALSVIKKLYENGTVSLESNWWKYPFIKTPKLGDKKLSKDHLKTYISDLKMLFKNPSIDKVWLIFMALSFPTENIIEGGLNFEMVDELSNDFTKFIGEIYADSKDKRRSEYFRCVSKLNLISILLEYYTLLVFSYKKGNLDKNYSVGAFAIFRTFGSALSEFARDFKKFSSMTEFVESNNVKAFPQYKDFFEFINLKKCLSLEIPMIIKLICTFDVNQYKYGRGIYEFFYHFIYGETYKPEEDPLHLLKIVFEDANRLNQSIIQTKINAFKQRNSNN